MRAGVETGLSLECLLHRGASAAFRGRVRTVLSFRLPEPQYVIHCSIRPKPDFGRKTIWRDTQNWPAPAETRAF
jgi:hypothetical protein